MRFAALALAGCSVTSIDVRARAPDTTTATPFALPAHDGSRFVLADALAKGDVVLVFYRGHW